MNSETIYRRRWWILVVLALSVFLVVVDNTIVNVALPTLSRDLNASTTDLQWIVDAYSLVFAGLLLAAGGLGDRIGRKGTGISAPISGSEEYIFTGNSGQVLHPGTQKVMEPRPLFTLPVAARVATTLVMPSPPTVERPLLTLALSLAATKVKLRFQNSPSVYV